ncbi:MAG: endonuclease/exonuclease/phosphatase family protein [Clostridia bacterium]|nr:endonuclease/exonuclease/phosphatase family protein [Clostridia bacterium]
MKLKVMTYNIAAGRVYLDYAETKKAPVDVTRCGEVIKNEAPAICGLNEVDCLTERSGGVDETNVLKEALGMEGFFGKAIDLPGGEYGNALLSKYPILEKEVIEIPEVKDKIPGYYYERRVILRAKLDVAGGITVLQLHSGLSDAEKINCIDKLCEVIDGLDTPVIVMGDFNMTPDYPALDKIRERLFDTKDLLNNGEFMTYGTYEGERKLHIDYIFLSKDIKPITLTVPDVGVSDHYPLVLECEI